MPDHAPETEAREFAAAFSAFLNWIHESDQESGNRNPVAALVADFLGREAAAHSVVSRELPPFEHVNLQTAIDAWSARAGRAVDVQGVLLPQHYRLGLQEIVSAEAVPPRFHPRLPQARAAACIRRPRSLRPAGAEPERAPDGPAGGGRRAAGERGSGRARRA
jgi:hypothetical protein